MNRQEYLALPGLNFSRAKWYLVSPAKYKAALDELDDPMKHAVGKLVHAMLLEGKDLRDLFIIQPKDIKLNTKVGKEWLELQRRYNGDDKPIMREEDANRVPRMAEAILNHEKASEALRACQGREVLMQGTYDGVDIKGILDAVGPNVLEIKTCIDPSDKAFAHRAINHPYHYDAQVAWYERLSKKRVAWILVENTPPHTVNFTYPGPRILASGKNKMQQIIAKHKRCTKLNDWSAYACDDFNPDLHEIDADEWLGRQLEGAGLL